MDNQLEKIPSHVAFIIDGNGRWAKEQGKPRSYGHQKGVAVVKKIAKSCRKRGIKVVSIFAFSTENWNRPQKEVDFLFKLFLLNAKQIDKKKDFDGVRYNFMGDLSKLPKKLSQILESIMQKTKDNTDFCVNIGINYGGRDEIVRAVNKLLQQGKKSVTIQDVKDNLDTSFLPDPELVVRSGGERRISNFMLWQIAYTEFYFPKTHWPAFTKRDLVKALKVYQKRNRRFGAIKEDNNDNSNKKVAVESGENK